MRPPTGLLITVMKITAHFILRLRGANWEDGEYARIAVQEDALKCPE
jgi:hypothetical protein